MNVYNETRLNMAMTAFVYIGALHYVANKFGYDPIVNINSYLTNLFKIDLYIDKIILLFISISIFILAMRRNTWLPFLGETVLPSSAVLLKPLEGKDSITIKVSPNTKVVYWTTKPNTELPDVVTAYGDFSQSGVVMSDEKGIATLTFNKGSGYIVPSGKIIKPHIHYRELKEKKYGIISEVKTAYLD